MIGDHGNVHVITSAEEWHIKVYEAKATAKIVSRYVSIPLTHWRSRFLFYSHSLVESVFVFGQLATDPFRALLERISERRRLVLMFFLF